MRHLPPGSDVSAASPFRDRCRRLGWAVGLPGLAAILGVSAAWITPRVEDRLGAEADAIARATAEPGAEPWLRVAVAGRDLILNGEAPDAATRDTAHRRLADLPGVRRLVGPVGLVALASPFVWIATRSRDGVDLTGSRPAEIGVGALAEQLAPALEPGTPLRDQAHAALGGPPDFTTAATYALARLRALTPGSRIMLEDTRLSILGEAASVSDDEALRAALTDLPMGYSLGRIAILPAMIPNFRFVVTRSAEGGLDLSGYVVSDAVRAEIRGEAAAAAENGQVTDRMRSARGLPPEIDAAAMARVTLQLAGLMQEGSVTVAEARVSLSGVALDAQAIPEIDTLLRTGLPAGLARGDVALTTRPLSPYQVAMRRDGDSVTLTGHLPDTATREALLGTLRARLFRERLIDRTRLGQGAPAELARALQVTAGSFTLLAKGEARIADRSVTLMGESLYPQGARRMAVDLSAAMPQGWNAETTLTSPGATAVRPPEACVTAFDAGAAGPGPVFSPGSATLKPAFYPRLDAIAVLAKTCPTLRLLITGHGDPSDPAASAKTAVANSTLDKTAVDKTAVDKPAVESAVESTASLEATRLEKPETVKRPGDKGSDKQDSKDKSLAKTAPRTAPKTAPKTDSAKRAPGQTDAKPAATAEPGPDLAQQRALAIVDYLLQAGLRPDQVAIAAGGTVRPAAEGVGIANRS